MVQQIFMEPISTNELAILSYLRADASQCGKVFHFDPSWVARKVDMYEMEFVAAARQLAARGLIAIHEFNWKQHLRMTDIVLVERQK
jgi:hypothetical protein